MKKISIKVIPRAKKERIIEDNGLFKVYVNAPAVEGKANKAVVEALADHFGVKRKAVSIVSGERCREKVVKIEGL